MGREISFVGYRSKNIAGLPEGMFEQAKRVLRDMAMQKGLRLGGTGFYARREGEDIAYIFYGEVCSG